LLPNAPLSLKDQRAHDKWAINELIKKNKNLLVPWEWVMDGILTGKAKQTFRASPTLDVFSDGFKLDHSPFGKPAGLAAWLRDHGLSVNTLERQSDPYYSFLQLKEGPYDLNLTLQNLRGAVMEMRKMQLQRGLGPDRLCLPLLDVT